MSVRVLLPDPSSSSLSQPSTTRLRQPHPLSSSPHLTTSRRRRRRPFPEQFHHHHHHTLFFLLFLLCLFPSLTFSSPLISHSSSSFPSLRNTAAGRAGAVYDSNHPSCAGIRYRRMPVYTHIGALRRLSRFSPSSSRVVSPSTTRTVHSSSSSSSSSPYSIVIVNDNNKNMTTKRSMTKPKSSVSLLTKFDDNHDDYDIFLRLAHDVNLHQSLHDFEHPKRTHLSSSSSRMSTLFVPRDIAIIQTALDIDLYLSRLNRRHSRKTKTKYNPLPNREFMSEYEAYQTIIKFTRRFRYPRAVLTAIIRNHVAPARLSLCDFIFSLYWTTWADKRVNRHGVILKTGSRVKEFIPAQLVLNILLPVKTRQGVIQQVDRMLIPDLSEFTLKLSPSPSPSCSPIVVRKRRKEKIKEMRTVPSSSPSQSAEPSTKAVPDITDPVVVPFPSHNGPGSGSGSGYSSDSSGHHDDDDDDLGDGIVVGPDTITGSQPPRTNCFPASASAWLCNGQRVLMRDLQIGDCVITSTSTTSPSPSRRRLTKSHVFMFSHRLETQHRMPFIQISTSGGHILSLSSEHYLPIHTIPFNQQRNSSEPCISCPTRLVTAQSVRRGMWVNTIDGVFQVIDTRIVYDYGLYAPHTHDGFVIVDGIVASCYTRAIHPHAAHSLLTPVRAVASIIGRSVDPVAGWFNHGSESKLCVRPLLSLVQTLTSLMK